jgi:hypothetical protein
MKRISPWGILQAFFAYDIVMLKLERKKFHKVTVGQTLEEISEVYKIPARLLVKANGLKDEPYAGQILYLPPTDGNFYTAQAGDTKALLCGSSENYEKKNGTRLLYPGMKVWI